MRCLAAALVMLVLSPAARAVPITGYAVGQVTENQYSLGPRRFTIGEPVYVRFTYDLDPPFKELLNPPGFALIAFNIRTGGGFNASVATSNFAFAQETDGNLTLIAGRDPWSVSLYFTGDIGRIQYDEDRGGPDIAFVASLTRVADDSAFPTPEPSTLAMGLVGVGMLAVAGMRRRRAVA